MSKKAKTGGVTAVQNQQGEDGECPEEAETEKSGVVWVETRDEKTHRRVLVRWSRKNTPEEKVVLHGGRRRKEAVVVHKAQGGSG